MDIMTTLFDQDYVTRLYGLDQREEGREEGKRDIARSLKASGMSLEFIEKHTGLTQKEILQL